MHDKSGINFEYPRPALKLTRYQLIGQCFTKEADAKDLSFFANSNPIPDIKPNSNSTPLWVGYSKIKANNCHCHCQVRLRIFVKENQ